MPDYQFTILTTHNNFIENDSWLQEIGDYWVCLYDCIMIQNSEMESRIVLFKDGTKIQFLFRLMTLRIGMSDFAGAQRIEYFGRSLNSNSWRTFRRMLINYN